MLFFNSITSDLIGILVAFLVIVCAYFKWTFQYWKNRGIETPNIIIPFGNTLDILLGTYTFGEIWRNYYNLFKSKGLPYGGAYFFTQKFFVPMEPELVKSIMQKDFDHFVNHANYVNEENDPLSGHLFSLKDAKWRNLRVKLTPTFTSGKMKMMFGTLANCAEELKSVLNELATNNKPVDIKEILACFSTDIIGSCAFGIECNSLKNPNSEFRKYGKKQLEVTFVEQLHSFLQFMLPDSLLHKLKYKITKNDVEEFFMNMTKKTVQYREKNNIYRKDFMHLLIQLRNLGKVTDDEKIVDGGIHEKGMTMEELTAQAFVFFLAGFETSSTTMTFALYELALNVGIQQKLRNEINEVLKKHDGKITYDAIMEMHYMDKVIYETLRKYPPVPVLTRECNKDYPVPNSDLVIEKGTSVMIPILGMQYDHEYYPNPTVFDPERFNEENKQSRPAYTWLPFGEGPRVCIGLRFGMMQSKVGLTTVLRNFEITMNKKTTVPLVFDKTSFILTAEGGIYLNAKKIEYISGDLFGILIGVCIIVYTYFKWSFQYWKKRGVETPNVVIPFGNSLDTFLGKYAIGDTWRNYYNLFKQKDLRYGGVFFFARKFFIPVDPEIIKSVMQKDFDHFVNHTNYVNEETDPLSGNLFSLKDAKWRNLRVKLTPTFTSGKMKMMFETLSNCGNELKSVVDENVSNNKPLDIKELLACFSTDVIGSCAFGIDCNTLKNPNSEFRTYGRKKFEVTFKEQLYILLQIMLPEKILDLIKFKATKDDVEEFFMDMTKKTVEYREKNNVYRKDFMHLLIQLKNLGKVTDDGRILDSGIQEQGLSMPDLTAQAFVFFVAGFETSSTTMTFALYELALNLEIQQKVRNEINSVLKKHDGQLTYEAILELHYMEKVINETLRKYPPLPLLSRDCNKDYQIPNSDLVLEKGTSVIISVLGLHYDHEYYPNPTVFDPERFSEENKQSRPAFTWLPFGEGPRICIGMRFGMMQTKFGLATILKNFEITMNKKTTVPLVFDKTSFVLSAQGGIYLNAKKIDS